MSYDFLLLYPVPPKTLADYRQAFFSSGAKSDPEDADLLLELVRCHADRLRVWQPEDRRTRQIQMLAEQRRNLVDDRTALTNRLTALLKESFPQALEWAGALSRPQACEFLGRWPSLQSLPGARRSEVRHFYPEQGGRDPAALEQRLVEIRQAVPLTSDPAVLQVSALMVQMACPTTAGPAAGHRTDRGGHRPPVRRPPGPRAVGQLPRRRSGPGPSPAGGLRRRPPAL